MLRYHPAPGRVHATVMRYAVLSCSSGASRCPRL